MNSRGLVPATAAAVVLICVSAALPGCSWFRGKKAAEAPPAAGAQPAAPGQAAPGAPVRAPAPEPTYYVHTVKYWGESVSIIAGWYTGDIKNWESLAAANPGINPNRIVQGDRIRIPENMMIKRDPMPKEWVDSFYPKAPARPKAPAPEGPKEEEEPALFGPKK